MLSCVQLFATPQTVACQASLSMGFSRLDEAQTGVKITRRNISNLRYAVDTTLKAESKEELKSFLMKVKEEREKLA